MLTPQQFLTIFIPLLRASLASTDESERGQTMIEYGLIVGVISIVVIVVLTNIGVNVTGLFTTASSNLHS